MIKVRSIVAVLLTAAAGAAAEPGPDAALVDMNVAARPLSSAIRNAKLAAAYEANPASPSALSTLNEAIIATLRPLNDGSRQVSLVVVRAVSNKARAIHVSVILHCSVRASASTVSIDVPYVRYNYPTPSGAQPRLTFQVQLQMNMGKYLHPSRGPALAAEVELAARSLLSAPDGPFGPRARFTAKAIGQSTGPDGQLTSARFELSASNGPSTTLTGRSLGTVQLSAMNPQGAFIRGELILDPTAPAFVADKAGLKETMDGLLAADQKLLSKIRGLAETLEQLARRGLPD